MKPSRLLLHAAVVLACSGLLLPQSVLAAGPDSQVYRDVTLGAGESLSGNLVPPEGRPLDGAMVTLRQGKQVIATNVSDRNGTFAFSGVSSGVYEMVVGQQLVPVRVWPSSAAPPASVDQTVIVVGPTARGQGTAVLDIITITTVVASTGALVLSAINTSELSKLHDKIDDAIDIIKSPN